MGSCSDARSHFLISMWNYYKYHDIIDVFDESEFLNSTEGCYGENLRCNFNRRLCFFVLGYLVWIKEKITLFHSYHYDKVEEENKKAFCKLSGIGLIVIGIGVLLAGIICSATSSMWGGIAIAIGFLFGLVMLIYAGIKYNR